MVRPGARTKTFKALLLSVRGIENINHRLEDLGVAKAEAEDVGEKKENVPQVCSVKRIMNMTGVILLGPVVMAVRGIM
jgi:hypothetical protein